MVVVLVGVVDRVRQLGLRNVVEVQFGAKADRQSGDQGVRFHYANKRAEMWGWGREWLMGGSIPNDIELRADLCGPTYNYVVRDGRDCVQLERKGDMKLRGLASPDNGDALMLTFAYPIAPGQSDRIEVPDWVPAGMRQHEHAYRWGQRQQAGGRAASEAADYHPLRRAWDTGGMGQRLTGTWKGIGPRNGF
jgi:hypothetical protein